MAKHTCHQMPVPVRDVCDDRWLLKKIWVVEKLEADDLIFNLRTRLAKPGVTSHTTGSKTPEQTVFLRVPVDAVSEGALIPLWVQNGSLLVSATYST